MVSIITISFNAETEIARTIESVLAQTYADIEYIFVDGASSDGTLTVIDDFRDDFAAKGIKYKVISEKDRGIYDAMNKGIRNAAGDIIGIINAGDWYEPEAVSTAVKEFKKNQCDVFFADLNIIKENGVVYRKKSSLDTIVSSRHWNHPTMFVKKEVYNDLGLYKCYGVHDDFEFYLRVRRSSKNIVVKNVALANFRLGGASNVKTWSKIKSRIKDRYWCYRTNGYSRLYILECLGIEFAKYIMG